MIDAQGAPEPLAGAVFRKLRQIRGSLRALLSLRGEEIGDDFEGVLARAAARYQVDVAPLRKVHEAPEAAHDALAKLLAAAVEEVDRMEDGVAS